MTVVLPQSMKFPAGGYLVHYRYAETLASLGHATTVIHPWSHSSPQLRDLPLCALTLTRQVAIPKRIVPWHVFTPGVRVLPTPWLHHAFLPRADVTLLSGWQTSERIHHRSAHTGPLVQLVYDYEHWATATPSDRERISKALSYPEIVRVAGSRVIQTMLHGFGASVATTITAGLDTARFRVLVEPDRRQRLVGFAARPGPHRGLEDVLAALEIARSTTPAIQVHAFGSAEPSTLPHWVHFARYIPDELLPAFYNRCAVFVLPSHYEGWGLPAAEAMACGAAVVTTANGGTEEFAIDGITALVVPRGNPEALAGAVVHLFDDDRQRISLANTGAQRASSMSWERSAEALLNVFEHVTARASGKGLWR